jgi:hypothetical protein
VHDKDPTIASEEVGLVPVPWDRGYGIWAMDHGLMVGAVVVVV